MSKGYYRVRLGEAGRYAEECRQGGFIGGHWDFKEDLTPYFAEGYRGFGEQCKPIFLERNPDKTKVAAGLACGMLWTICKGVQVGDIVMCPAADGRFMLGRIASEYYCVPDGILPQRRKVEWLVDEIERGDVSDGLKRSTNGPGTVVDIAPYAEEIERLIGHDAPPAVIATSEVIEDPSTFALEKHLEDFLVTNWAQTELGRQYDIFSDEGELVGQQYPSDTGPIDILAMSKDRKTLLVVELKRGRASDVVVGQVQRYMGYVAGELAEEGQSVRGVIIALEDDLRLQRALSVTQNIDFYRYQVSFRLVQV